MRRNDNNNVVPTPETAANTYQGGHETPSVHKGNGQRSRLRGGGDGHLSAPARNLAREPIGATVRGEEPVNRLREAVSFWMKIKKQPLPCENAGRA